MDYTHLNLQKTTVFHLNTIGSLIIFISLPDELYNEPKSMKFFHKCENNQIEIKIKSKSGNVLIDYKYNFKDNSLSVINIKETLPKIISISSNNNNNNIKYIKIKYSITKSAVNDYFFSDKILNFDTLYDYLEKIIEKNFQKTYKKLKLHSIFCKSCKKNYLIKPKEIIFDYDSIRIEQNFEEFFNCQNNFNSFMKNEQATEGIENLKKTYEIKYNLDNLYFWIFDKYLDNIQGNDMDIDNMDTDKNLILCENCKEIIGIKEEHSLISFNKLFFNSLNFKLVLDDNEDNPLNIENIFTVDYLNILLVYSINKGNKYFKFINRTKQIEIVFETKMNIVGLIDKDNNLNNEEKIFLIDNYINMFQVTYKEMDKSEVKEDLVGVIYLNEQDFNILDNIINENIKKYLTEFFFYKLLTNENKKYYCFSFPKKINKQFL